MGSEGAGRAGGTSTQVGKCPANFVRGAACVDSSNRCPSQPGDAATVRMIFTGSPFGKPADISH